MSNSKNWVDFEQSARQKIQPPAKYAVVLHNDDYTPMEFVIEVLQKFFSYDEEKAIELMLAVHHKGKAVCGIFTAEIAETKVLLVNQYAKAHEYPLLCTLEKV